MRTILNGAPDSNGDLRYSVYEYDVWSGDHEATKWVYVDWVNVGSVNPKLVAGPFPHKGPYKDFGMLP